MIALAPATAAADTKSCIASQADMTFGPDSLGDTTQNWIGRSVYAADPYLTGQVDDFRLYSGALTSAQVAALASM